MTIKIRYIAGVSVKCGNVIYLVQPHWQESNQ